ILLSAAAHGGTHDSSENPDPMSKSLILVKLWCLTLVFMGTFVPGISPYFMKWNEGFLVLGTQFAGGVFLGTALMHFLSDSNQKFGELTNKKYPFAFMLASGGYLLMMLADCVVSYVHGKESDETSADVEHDAPLAAAASLGDTILLIVALCFHSVFEGIAIGVAETKGDAWKALWTVSLHKIFAAVAMGIALLRIVPDRSLFSCVAYAFAFAMSSPLGVAIGLVIDATTQSRVADWVYAISTGLACGVFISVSINHLLSKGYTPRQPVLVDTLHYRFLAALLGVGVIAVVMIWDT
ncbi:hypothetical protein RJ640_018884, partial [Escallonia rubra]